MYRISMHWGESICFSTSSACWYLCSALVWSKSVLIYLSSRLCQHEPISPHLDRDRWNRSYKLSSSFNRQLRINMRMVKGRALKLIIILRSFKEPLELTVIKPDIVKGLHQAVVSCHWLIYCIENFCWQFWASEGVIWHSLRSVTESLCIGHERYLGDWIEGADDLNDNHAIVTDVWTMHFHLTQLLMKIVTNLVHSQLQQKAFNWCNPKMCCRSIQLIPGPNILFRYQSNGAYIHWPWSVIL